MRSGGLFVVDFAGPVTDKPELLSIVKESVDLKIGEQRLRPVAFLSPPQHRSTFRNFAISKSWVVAHYQGLSSSRTLRIMIIWQSPPGPTSERPVLHTYGLGRRHNSDTFTSLRFDLQDRCSKLRVFESLYNDIGPKAEAQLLERPAKICCIQGERVSSIDVVTGGIYPANPCMNPDTVPGNEQCTGSDAALSGFEISPEDGDRCYVWGASASSSTPHVTLQVFDLRPGGNKRSEWWWWPDLEAYPMNCGCKLHDHGYRVTLPLAQTRSHCSPPTSFLQKLRGTDAPEILPDEGTVEHYNPPARAEALQRRGEGHKEIIRQLRRDGWSHGAIEEGWTGVQWTRRGCIPKPDGWREL